MELCKEGGAGVEMDTYCCNKGRKGIKLTGLSRDLCKKGRPGPENLDACKWMHQDTVGPG